MVSTRNHEPFHSSLPSSLRACVSPARRTLHGDDGGSMFFFKNNAPFSSSTGTGSPDVFNSLPNLDSDCLLSSAYTPAGRSTAGVAGSRIPFTEAQWHELARQTLAYKYMKASVPVPHDLLQLITSTSSNAAPLHSNDREPWRCKRTDGKKWRCSRDAAPDQKYCERHSHKGRLRSRKTVELPNNESIVANMLDSRINFPAPMGCRLSMSASSSSTSNEQSRCLEWFFKENMVSETDNSKQEMMDWKRDERNRNGRRSAEKDDFSGCFATATTSSEKQTQGTRHFIDGAWSCEDHQLMCCAVSEDMNLPQKHSSLALSISGIEECDNRSRVGGVGHAQQWMTTTGSLMSSPPGGPLGEVLCLGISRRSNSNSNLFPSCN